VDRVQLSENFFLDEFQCSCCGGVHYLKGELVTKLQAAREYLGVGLIITSGSRCQDHHLAIYASLNRPVVKNSRHLSGMAVDVKKSDGSNFTVDELAYLKRHFGGIGITESLSWLHLDTGPKRYWTYENE